MKELTGGLENVKGYRFSAIECGIRYSGRLDYCLILSDVPCSAAGVFTKNMVVAAPVKLCRKIISNRISGVLINATNANACTGEEGYANANRLVSDIETKLNIPAGSVLAASTGIVGRHLPVEKMLASHGALIKGLSSDEGKKIPGAIMTTDTFPKQSAASFSTSMGEFTIAGTAKGSGMIAPNMATLLSFIITDAPVKKTDLDRIFRSVINKTLNALTIDGDMSTNDTAIILSPDKGDYLSTAADLENFEKALNFVLYKLSEMLVYDAEGATKLVKVCVKNAAHDDDAMKIARSVSQSLLVKTAFFGMDPNWGRIAVAAGYSGADIREESLSVFFGDIQLLKNGSPQEYNADALRKILAERNFTVTVDAGLGNGEAFMLTSDISYEYVKINAEYST